MTTNKIKYKANLSISQLAKLNNVSEATIRKYIKVNRIDRRHDAKMNLIIKCREYYNNNPEATKSKVSIDTHISLKTVRKYWENIVSDKELEDFDTKKTQSYRRQTYDFYATHSSVVEDLLREEDFSETVLEPFCGNGSIGKVLESHKYNVVAYDLVNRGYGKVGDFFKVDFPHNEMDIITNPPFQENIFIDIVLKCLSICKNKVALLLPLSYLSSKGRYERVFSEYPPKVIYVYVNRIILAMNGKFDKYSRTSQTKEYAWFVWEKSFNGSPIIKWIYNKED